MQKKVVDNLVPSGLLLDTGSLQPTFNALMTILLVWTTLRSK
jgi:hypothetical protein